MKYKKASEGRKVQQKDYTKVILFSADEFKDHSHLLQVVTIPPRIKQRLHYHKDQIEVYYILEGEAEIYMNDQVIVAHPGDAFICEAGDKHFLWNKTDKEFTLAVFKIDYPLQDDTVWLEE